MSRQIPLPLLSALEDEPNQLLGVGIGQAWPKTGVFAGFSLEIGMADAKLVAGSVARGSSEPSRPRGHKHHHHHHHHHQDPELPTPPFDLTTTTFFVRANGSDAHGNGSLQKPFKTFQRAIRQVPSIPAPGASFVIDVTGITETFPSDYQLPVIQTSTIGAGIGAPSPFPFFLFQSGIVIRAIPQLASLLSPADAVIGAVDGAVVSSDPVSNLVTLTIGSPRASWAANSLKGKQLIRTVQSATSNQASCSIFGSDSTHLFLCNDADSLNGGNGALVLAANEVLQIVEPSATFIGSTPTGNNAWGIASWGINAPVFQGIHFVAPAGLYALALGNADIPAIELCVVDGFLSVNAPNGLEIFGTTMTTSYDLEPVPGLLTRSLFTNFALPESYFNIAAILQTFNDTVFDNTCPTLTTSQFFTPVGSNWGLENVLFQGSTGDAIHADYGHWNLTNVAINNAAGIGLLVDTGPTAVTLTNVGGTGNAGLGLVVNDGAQVRVADTVTNVGEDSGGMQVGGLPARSWADFYANTPVGNQYDLVQPFVLNAASGLLTPQGNDSAGASTGSRVFQR